MPPDYMHIIPISCQIGLINREESYNIYISELKVAAFSCQIDDLVVPIWPYQFFNALQSDRWSDPNTCGKRTFYGSPRITSRCITVSAPNFHQTFCTMQRTIWPLPLCTKTDTLIENERRNLQYRPSRMMAQNSAQYHVTYA